MVHLTPLMPLILQLKNVVLFDTFVRGIYQATLEEVQSKTKIKYCPSTMGHKVDIYSIDYTSEETESEEAV